MYICACIYNCTVGIELSQISFFRNRVQFHLLSCNEDKGTSHGDVPFTEANQKQYVVFQLKH